MFRSIIILFFYVVSFIINDVVLSHTCLCLYMFSGNHKIGELQVVLSLEDWGEIETVRPSADKPADNPVRY